jgi:NDP-sugar pyrophosphorylase family protein
MRTVLITTSGTGSRLGHATRYVNKSLVKVGDKYAICHILDLYDSDTEFVITVGYLGQQVVDFLMMAYPEKRFTFVWVDKYQGPGSSLVYSIRKARQELQKPFTFHCCDTLFKDPPGLQESNTVWVAKHSDLETYAGIQGENGHVTQINKKGNPNMQYIYTGVSYIASWETFWKSLDSIYEADSNNTTLSDVDVMRAMIESGEKFSFQIVDGFYDTGNQKSLEMTREAYKQRYNVLEKDNESLCFIDEKVIKFINDEQINKKRYLRGKELYPSSPKILGYTNNFLCMELVVGTVLSEVNNYGEIKRLLKWAETNLWTKCDIKEEYRASCMRFYRDKTISRLKSLPDLKNEKEIINGIQAGSVVELLDRLNFEALTTDTFYRFHGDFILDNIIKKSTGEYCLLDWRHEFDTHLYFGDKYYDLAKLRHNIIFNHKNIINKLYFIEEQTNEVKIDLKCNYFLMRQLEEFDAFADAHGYDKKKIRMLTSIIWLNMAPLYEPPLSSFLFYFGKINLYLELMNS